MLKLRNDPLAGLDGIGAEHEGFLGELGLDRPSIKVRIITYPRLVMDAAEIRTGEKCRFVAFTQDAARIVRLDPRPHE